ncbi:MULTISPECIES: hypothetical protein [Pseudoalteromonas]|jgi:hypothetical protein|uniref:hypothetical protein n=1 Tax=Pseudoalteromonas TaxID=53246 RepID=UPI00026D0129|nr:MULTISPECIES: hypothetical protein [Pseudoalteromonas]MCK8120533.1 hypothetical protein [Pseudoalteromonas sp. 2CM32C]MDA8939882.1 hypothetical protein [Pseudoalteromonas marina]MDN3393473.1 hypothetical protein [Pseudoalteromonas sp. APC 3215]MDN3401331.1 hypothetical protein [Pseudoalteromonas sp. APC 3213]MDN3430319.1 hypothetical protein [Pseudoalteromonas sp. APC 3907]|tara:strand:+ start:128 stop:505 length:378 start_codon:yes stop_codon:yes gene_type:complete
MDRVVIFVLCFCLFIGGATHIFDNLYYGFLPYKFAPEWVNIYWTALAVIDIVAVYLLIKWRNAGLVLTLVIMLSDVAINSVAFYLLNVLSDSSALQLQTLFLGFCIGSSIWLWQSKSKANVVNVT